MAKPDLSAKRLLGNRVETLTHRASEKLSSEVEKIVYKVMTNPGLETTIANAIQKGLISFILRYWWWAGLGLVGLLLVHTLILMLVLSYVVR